MQQIRTRADSPRAQNTHNTQPTRSDGAALPPTMFAQTEHLTLRAYRDSDLALLHALWNDPQVQRTGTNEGVVPRGPKWARDTLPAQMETSLLHVIIEVTDPSAHEPRGEDDGAARKGAEVEGEKFVGCCLLQMPNAKNRDAALAIVLVPRWWGRGFGAEAVRWTVDCGFENPGLHRISLAVMDGNDRAVSLYTKLYVDVWSVRGVLGAVTNGWLVLYSGFVVEGRKRECSWLENGWKDYITMGMLRREWAALRAARI